MQNKGLLKQNENLILSNTHAKTHQDGSDYAGHVLQTEGVIAAFTEGRRADILLILVPVTHLW